MNANDLKDIFGIAAESERIERDRCLAAVDAEPEPTDDMPDELWRAIAGDRDAMREALRLAVRMTKDGIRARILGEQAKGGGEGNE